MKNRREVVVALAGGSLALSGMARAQLNGSKQIKMICAYPAGGTADYIARVAAMDLADRIKMPVIVINQPGGNTAVGTRQFLGHPADGLTLLCTSTTVITNAMLVKPQQWKPDDFLPVALHADMPGIVCVPATSPVKTLEEFVAYCKKNPGLQWGLPGAGGPSHLLTCKFATVAGISPSIIQYKGQPPAIPDLVAGRLGAGMMTPFPSVISLIKDGKLKALVVFAKERMPDLPQVPTNAEAGFGEASLPCWIGTFVRRGTPADIYQSLVTNANATLQTKEFQLKMRQSSLVPNASLNLAQLKSQYAADSNALAKVIRESNIQLDE